MDINEDKALIIGVSLLTIVAPFPVGVISYHNGYWSGYEKKVEEERIEKWCYELGGIKRDIDGYYIDSGLCRTIHE